MKYLTAAPLNPWQSNGDDCPFDCIGCPHFVGASYNDGELEIECDNE